MKNGAILYPLLSALALWAAPAVAWANTNPDFDDDATPILRQQPGLLDYVHSRFEVKDTGTAKYPGDDDRRPQPPFIFRARPIGSHGAFNLRLLIQPGPPGHILGVVDITKAHINQPETPSQPPQVANQPAPQEPAQPAPAPQPSTTEAPASQPSQPTSDTPSGPIKGTDSQGSSANPPSLTPPPDPAPSGQ